MSDERRKRLSDPTASWASCNMTSFNRDSGDGFQVTELWLNRAQEQRTCEMKRNGRYHAAHGQAGSPGRILHPSRHPITSFPTHRSGQTTVHSLTPTDGPIGAQSAGPSAFSSRPAMATHGV
ncbi:hypothetical protein ACCO45_013557 [Purpureocillium lilacinum]|uniref:Uncharacterized protein n=1 Tax=Purpureocillium lilacinum TaxID=33203 RepID=A0ACC4D6E4_PURLI